MSKAPVRIAQDSRGAAAIEFVLIVPVLLLLLGGLGDFALAFWYKGLLASSVAQGASYAAMKGPTVTAPVIQGIVGQKLALPASSVTVTGPGATHEISCRLHTEFTGYPARILSM